MRFFFLFVLVIGCSADAPKTQPPEPQSPEPEVPKEEDGSTSISMRLVVDDEPLYTSQWSQSIFSLELQDARIFGTIDYSEYWDDEVPYCSTELVFEGERTDGFCNEVHPQAQRCYRFSILPPESYGAPSWTRCDD